jgi:hypothetical protein
MTDIFALANEAVLRTAGAVSEWEEQVDHTGRPASTIAGVPLNGSIATTIVVDLRHEIHRRRCVITVETSGLTDTWGLSIDGNAVSYDADVEGAVNDGDVLLGLKADIEATPAAAVLVSAEVLDLDDDGVVDTLILYGKGEDDYSIDWSSDAAGVLGVEADAISCDYIVRTMADGAKAPTPWRRAGNGKFDGLDTDGDDRRLNTASRARVHVQTLNVAGHASDGASVMPVVRVWVGRGIVG